MKNQVARSKKQHYEHEDRLTYVMWKAQHASERCLLAALADTGLNLSHLGLLTHLDREPGLTGAEIARRHDVTPQSVSVAVATARERGLIRATKHPVHRGLVELELTDLGRETLQALRERVSTVDDQITKALGKKGRETLLQLLRRVREVLRRPDAESAPR